jgi:hypothetical protein
MSEYYNNIKLNLSAILYTKGDRLTVCDTKRFEKDPNKKVRDFSMN